MGDLKFTLDELFREEVRTARLSSPEERMGQMLELSLLAYGTWNADLAERVERVRKIEEHKHYRAPEQGV